MFSRGRPALNKAAWAGAGAARTAVARAATGMSRDKRRRVIMVAFQSIGWLREMLVTIRVVDYGVNQSLDRSRMTKWDPRRLNAVAVALPDGVTPPGTRGRILHAALK